MLYSTSQPSRWWGLKTLQRGLRFSSIFWSSTIQGKTEEEHFCDFCSEALQSLQSRPWARPAHVANSWPRARLQVLKNSGSWMFMFKVKTLSAQNCHWWNPRKKRAAEEQYKKRTRQCTDGLSATQNGQVAAESFSTQRESNTSRPTHFDSS